MNPAGIAITVFLAACVLFLPRAKAALAVMAAVCFITQGQQVVALGFHFTAIRIVLLAALLRLAFRGEFREITLNKIDSSLVLYGIAITGISVWRVGTSEEFVYRLGCAYDIGLSYFVFRGLLSRWDDAMEFLRGVALLAIPVAMEMLFELFTRQNLFHDFGGIGELTIRGGRPRCEGAFRHGITAGVFGASLMPIFACFRWHGRWSRLVVLGLFATIIITYTSNSSGPLITFLSGIVALGFWRFRRKMRTVRWYIALGLLCLHLVMKAPVWFLFAKLSDITGGDGWYRSQLVDVFIRRFPEWWLRGTSNTAEWMPTAITFADGTQQADLTNAYVACGVAGGLLTLILFVAIMVECFRGLGTAMMKVSESSPDTEMLLWGLGAALFAHVVTLFSVTYFDQMQVVWWGFLAIIAGVTSDLIETETETEIDVETGEPIPSLTPDRPIPGQLGSAPFR